MATASQIITDSEARAIAAEYTDGSRISYMFVSGGAIESTTQLASRYWLAKRELPNGDPNRRRINNLMHYFEHHGQRGPITGWSYSAGRDGSIDTYEARKEALAQREGD